MEESQNYFRKCGSCKKEIPFGATYVVCEVSSCRKHVFCHANCWSLHNDIMNHKNAGAIEETAPIGAPRRILINPSSKNETAPSSSASTSVDTEILIVASKLKQYVKEKFDLSTSANVMEKLTQIVKEATDKASRNARQEGRKTLMDRDF